MGIKSMKWEGIGTETSVFAHHYFTRTRAHTHTHTHELCRVAAWRCSDVRFLVSIRRACDDAVNRSVWSDGSRVNGVLSVTLAARWSSPTIHLHHNAAADDAKIAFRNARRWHVMAVSPTTQWHDMVRRWR